MPRHDIAGERTADWREGWWEGAKRAHCVNFDARPSGMLPELMRRVPGVRYDAITLEFGTATDLSIVRALRAENQLHFHGRRTPDHPALHAMREAFYPDDARWQAGVVGHAQGIHRQAAALLASG